MAAFKAKLVIDQGATFRKQFVWKTGTPAAPVNLTGYTARMQIRPAIDSATVLATLTTENGGITLGGVAGTIALFIAHTATTDYTWEDGVYDLELVTPAGDVLRKIAGTVAVTREVTR
jgi:hypothetical protein